MSDVEQVPHIQVTKCLVHPVAFAEPSDSPSSKILLPDTVVAFPRSMPELVLSRSTGPWPTVSTRRPSPLDKVAAINRVSCRAGAEARFSSTQMAADYVAVYERILEANG